MSCATPILCWSGERLRLAPLDVLRQLAAVAGSPTQREAVLIKGEYPHGRFSGLPCRAIHWTGPVEYRG